MRAWVPYLVRVGALTGAFLLLFGSIRHIPYALSPEIPPVIWIQPGDFLTAVLSALVVEGCLEALRWAFREKRK